MAATQASVVAQSVWANPGTLQGEIEGRAHGVGLSLIMNDFASPGRGPAPHSHDYAETIVVLSGSALASVDGEERVIAAGDIVFLPAGVVHAFKSLPGEPFRAVDIHESPRFATHWQARTGS